MATSCVIRVHDKTSNHHLVTIYKHSGGQPSQFGQSLADFLVGFDDILPDRKKATELNRHAVGGGCLAAQLIKHFKEAPGEVYIAPSDFTREVIYDIYCKDEQPTLLACEYYEERVFDGLPEDFDGVEIMRRWNAEQSIQAAPSKEGLRRPGGSL